MAEDRIRTGGKNHGHPFTFGAQSHVPERVDPAMNAVQVCRPDAPGSDFVA